MSELINLDELVDDINEEEERREEERNQKPMADENFLSFKAGNTYLVRLLPNVNNPKMTFTPYEEYGFKSVVDGSYIYAGRTPFSVGRKDDPVKKLQWDTYSSGKEANDEATMKRSYTLFPQEKEMVNVYVIDDPVNPENNGTVKILRYSAKTNKAGEPISPLFGKFKSAIKGDDKEEIGKRAFDLTENGVNFAIKVKDKAGWNDYAESSFKFPSDLGLSESEIADIYKQTKDLEQFIPEVKTNEELLKILDVHWFGKDVDTEESDLSNDSDDDLQDETSNDDDSSVAEIDDDMDQFLDGLDDDDDD